MSIVRAVRGAITIENNTVDEIKSATVEMLSTIIDNNNFEISDIVFAEFTVTSDITAATPAKFARTELGWNTVPLMCTREFEFDNSLKMAIRVLIVFNSNLSQYEVNHVYLKDASKLRPDLKLK